MSNQDIYKVYKNIVKHLKNGLKHSHANGLGIGAWDEVDDTVDAETMEIPIFNIDGVELETLIDIGQSHPCYLCSEFGTRNAEHCIIMKFLWVDPETSEIGRRKRPVKHRDRGWSFTFLILIAFIAMALAFLKEIKKIPF